MSPVGSGFLHIAHGKIYACGRQKNDDVTKKTAERTFRQSNPVAFAIIVVRALAGDSSRSGVYYLKFQDLLKLQSFYQTIAYMIFQE